MSYLFDFRLGELYFFFPSTALARRDLSRSLPITLNHPLTVDVRGVACDLRDLYFRMPVAFTTTRRLGYSPSFPLTLI